MGMGKMAYFDGLCIVRLGFKQGDPLFTYRRFIAASVVVLSKLFVLSKSDPLTTNQNKPICYSVQLDFCLIFRLSLMVDFF